jgi:hypothetical protein
MQLVPPVQLLPPSICIICETQPDGDAVVDTLYTMRTGVASVLNGRKYVCERCVGEFAKLFGFEKGSQVQEAQFDRDLARRELANVRDNITKFADSLTSAINHPGVVAEGQTFEDLFQPPAVDVVREASASRLSAIESRGDTPVKPVTRKAKERASVPNPGLDVTEVPDTEDTVPASTVNAAKDDNGSVGSEDS